MKNIYFVMFPDVLIPELLSLVCSYLEGSRISFSLISKQMNFSQNNRIYLDSGGHSQLLSREEVLSPQAYWQLTSLLPPWLRTPGWCFITIGARLLVECDQSTVLRLTLENPARELISVAEFVLPCTPSEKRISFQTQIPVEQLERGLRLYLTSDESLRGVDSHVDVNLRSTFVMREVTSNLKALNFYQHEIV